MKKIVVMVMALCLVQSTSNIYASGVSVVAAKVAQSVLAMAVKTKNYIAHNKGLAFAGAVALAACGILQIYFSCELLFSAKDNKQVLKDENGLDLSRSVPVAMEVENPEYKEEKIENKCCQYCLKKDRR